MQNQINYSQILDKLPSVVVTLLTTIVIIGSYFYIRGVFKKADEIEENIFIVKDWLDNIEYIVLMQRGPVAQSVIDGVSERDSKPLKAELERLKMERQFLLDGVPLLGVLKK